MKTYRNLTEQEIIILKDQNYCSAEDWGNIQVKEGFNPNSIWNAKFSGKIKLGVFNTSFELPGGLKKQSGIRKSTLHNVEVGDNTCIENIHDYIANYTIGENTYINNVNSIYVEGESSFGNGVRVSVLDETGGREIPIFSELSAQLAYMSVLYRNRKEFINKLESLAAEYIAKHTATQGYIGSNVTIKNTSTIKNVRVGSYTIIDGAMKLENGSINSEESAPVLIGNSVIAKDFIFSSGSHIDNAVTLSRCFVGQACHLSNNYSATDSLFFSNSHGENGEACAIFAGPYTVTHHKSTLLIAGIFSFMNAGSGSNQSNHMYKLGPIHHGILERGSKTTSDSYVLYPSHIGPFTLVMGRHVDHVDTSNFPFSYLIEHQNTTFLVPGVNLRSVGTIRDAKKWPERDKRKGSLDKRLDYIKFDMLCPFVIQKMIEGIKILKGIRELSGDNCEIYTYQNANIRKSALISGLEYYNLAIQKFIGDSIIRRLEGKTYSTFEEFVNILRPTTEIGKGRWVDLAGLFSPKSEVDLFIKNIENAYYNDLCDLSMAFKSISDNYYEYEWTWTCSMIEELYKMEFNQLSADIFATFIQDWRDAVIQLDDFIYSDTKKEFSSLFKTAYGVDGAIEDRDLDFYEVRGDISSNKFAQSILDHKEKKEELANTLLEFLNKEGS